MEFIESLDTSSIVISCLFIFIIFWMVVGLWPFNKFFGYLGLRCFLKKTSELDKNIKQAVDLLPKENHRNFFVQEYSGINEKFSSRKYIFHHLWREFSEQLVEPTDKEPAFQNSIRPKDFFTLEYLLKNKNINTDLLASLPGILVGLGVLGTFTGLSLSLLKALPYLSGENQNPEEAVAMLISGASVAFVTSVAGLLCSLIFNFIFDKRKSLLQSGLNKFNVKLERSLKFITEEHLLVEHLKELKQHGKHLDNMDEKISLKIGDHIKQMGDKVHKVISESNQNISEKFLLDMANQMTKGMGDFSRKQVENLDKTLNALQKNIPPLISKLEHSQKESTETSKELINHLAVMSRDSQKHINRSLLEMTQNMKSEFESIIQNMKQGMGQTLSNSSEELRKLITSLGTMNQNILEKTDESRRAYQNQLDETAHKLHSFTDRLEKSISEINNVTSKNIMDALQTFSDACDQQKQIVTENKQYIHSLNNLADSLKPIPSSLSETTEKISEIAGQINSSGEDLKTSWSNYERRFKDVDQSAEQIFIKLKEGLELISRKSAGYIENLNSQTARVSGSFSQAVEDLRETIDELQKGKEDLKSFSKGSAGYSEDPNKKTIQVSDSDASQEVEDSTKIIDDKKAG